jgi:hypothetical protein
MEVGRFVHLVVTDLLDDLDPVSTTRQEKHRRPAGDIADQPDAALRQAAEIGGAEQGVGICLA